MGGKVTGHQKTSTLLITKINKCELLPSTEVLLSDFLALKSYAFNAIILFSGHNEQANS